MDDFIPLALRTEATPPTSLTSRQGRLLHAALGLVTESGEFADALKKHLFYQKPLDEVNLKEEIGDILWYAAIALDELDSDFDAEERRVIAKLRSRYPSKFTSEAAITRDLKKEREVLEQAPSPIEGCGPMWKACDHQWVHKNAKDNYYSCSRCGAMYVFL